LTIPNLTLGRADAVVEQEKEKIESQRRILESKFEKFTETHSLRAQAAAVKFIISKRSRSHNQLSKQSRSQNQTNFVGRLYFMSA